MIPPRKGSSDRDRWPTALALLVLGVSIGLILVSVIALPDRGGPPNTEPLDCAAPDARVADPSGPHGLFVLNPPTNSTQAYFADTLQYLVNTSAVCGADFTIHWNQIDAGPNVTPRYNWSVISQEIAPWQAAGKEVNLIFQAVGYGPNRTYVPAYALQKIQTFQCGVSSVTPFFWTPTYISFYQGFIRAVVTHFDGDSKLGYIRFGLGIGGETFPVFGLQNDPQCDSVLNATGFTVANWTSYLVEMLEFEHSLNSSVQLMVALNGVFPGIPDNVPKTVAATAVNLGIGIGGEGLAESQVSYTSNGEPDCQVGICGQFEEYAGQVPLELQTFSASQPNGSGPTGSLTVILPWAVGIHTQIFELYLADWLTAYDPNFPMYSEYHSAYASAFDFAAGVVDG